MEEKLKNILAQVLKIDTSIINDTSSPDNIQSWDSFNGLMLVTELEKGFAVKFTIDEVMAVRNVKDIKDSLRQHGVDI
jgi:acyl carrier protein